VTNADLVKLVVQANAGLALATWPFVIYEVFSKSAPVSTLKLNLDVKRGQLLKRVTDDIERELQPFWPKQTSVILVDPNYRLESAAVFSDAAASAVTKCLERSESLVLHAARVGSLASTILRLDRIVYWLVFTTAVASLVCLLGWFVANGMPDILARLAIFTPAATASSALVSAGIRQAYHHKAQKEMID
jgi:hypothetical protein